jgi:hypothetical protein
MIGAFSMRSANQKALRIAASFNHPRRATSPTAPRLAALLPFRLPPNSSATLNPEARAISSILDRISARSETASPLLALGGVAPTSANGTDRIGIALLKMRLVPLDAAQPLAPHVDIPKSKIEVRSGGVTGQKRLMHLFG